MRWRAGSTGKHCGMSLLREGPAWRYVAAGVFGAGLIFTTYFGWAMIGCLTVIFMVSNGRGRQRAWRPALLVLGGPVIAFTGVAPWDIAHAQFMDPPGWEGAGRPVQRDAHLVVGAAHDDQWEPTARAIAWLDDNCEIKSADRRMKDDGAGWKKRLFSSNGQLEWRIEVRACDSSRALPPQGLRAELPGGM